MATVSEIMVTEVIVASQEYMLSVLEKMMENKGVGHIFITEGSKLVGIVSDGDIKRRKSYLAGSDVSTNREEQTLQTKAHQIMSRNLKTLGPQSDILDAVNLLLNNDIHSIPIVEKDNKLIGLITSTDLLKYLKHLLSDKE
ncbi:MAG: CBS domain-containing protein [Lentisphaeraceae bacterium]|nr:CBS domain-containing protein [Lentisphaeraceae bacterium]